MLKKIIEDKFKSIQRKFISNIRLANDDILMLRDLHKESTPLYVIQNGTYLEHLILNLVLDYYDFTPPKHITPSKIFNKIKDKFNFIKQKSSSDKFYELLHNKQSCSFSLSSWKTYDSLQKDFEFDNLYQTVSYAQNNTDNKITIIPVIVLWYHYGSRKNLTDNTIIQSLPLMNKLSEKSIKFVLSALKTFKPVIKFGKPLNVHSFVNNSKDLQVSELTKNLSFQIFANFEQTWNVILGPEMERLSKIKRQLEHNPKVIEAYYKVVENGVTPEDALKDMNKAINELPADISPSMLLFLMNALKLVWYKIYKGFDIDEGEFERLAKASENGPLLIIPCHKSHLDYLIISWIMQKFNLPVPHIAAGRNLSFWPLGTLFRGGGAFFIRRSFKGNPLYKTIVREYMSYLFNLGANIEFFIEGTRSRSGKVVYPKMGMLYFTAELVAEGEIPDPQIVPVSIGYERVVEEDSYFNEMQGAAKQSENIAQVVKASSVMFNKYGVVNLHFAKPFGFRKFLGDVLPASDDFSQKVEALAFYIMKQIVDYSVITPSMLVASAILSTGEDIPYYQAVYEKYVFYRNFALDNHLFITETLHKESALLSIFQETLHGFSGLVSVKGSKIYVNKHKRARLAYYRNGYLQSIVIYAIASLNFIENNLFSSKKSDLKVMFKREFPHINVPYDENEVLLIVKNLTNTQKKYLANLLFDIIEGQSFVFIYLIKQKDINSKISIKKIKQNILQYVDKNLKLLRKESLNGFVFLETINLLKDEQIVFSILNNNNEIDLTKTDFQFLRKEYLHRRKLLAALKTFNLKNENN